MKLIEPSSPKLPLKAATGIPGFDEITGGGLPRGRTTLLTGGPGTGKTIYALQFLVNGARKREPGIFIAFEESSERVVANAASFGWKLPDLKRKALFFLNAQPKLDEAQSGHFDLWGMLAVLDAKAKEIKARRIVFDALDVVLALLPDLAAKRREVYRLHDWLLGRGLTGLITAKCGADELDLSFQNPLAFMQFMVDCTVILRHRTAHGASLRTLRVQKYRGSDFTENEAPYLIGEHGMEISITQSSQRKPSKMTSERVSSGVPHLDTMLGGGYFRNASVLITGTSGTAKTTLSAAFVRAACQRGEHTTFVTFDSNGADLLRNMDSVGIRLDRFTKSGLLDVVTARANTGSIETWLKQIKVFCAENKTRCLVIDPLPAWPESIGHLTTSNAADRLVDWAKANGITLICTKLIDEVSDPAMTGTSLHVSTVADTWIHLTNQVRSGERNRTLSIIKSRGTAHSNQVRELMISNTGMTLADTYTSAGEVLMGTLRWEKEQTEALENKAAVAAVARKRMRLDSEASDLERRLKDLELELIAKQLEKSSLTRSKQGESDESKRHRIGVRELRGAGVPAPKHIKNSS